MRSSGYKNKFQLLDTGAGSSYVSSGFINYIGIKPQRREYRQIEMLMHTSTTKLNIYNIDIISTRGNFTVNTEVTKVEKNYQIQITSE